MFDRYIRLAKAKDALAGGRFEEAAKNASDPKIADDRRAVAIRNDAQKALCARARERAAKGDLPTAVREFERAQAIGASADIEVEVEALRRQLAEQQRNAAASDEALRRARRLADQGRLADAERELASLPSEGSNAEREALASHVRGKRERATEQLMAARDALAAGDLAAAQDALLRARACDADASGPQCAAVVKAVARSVAAESAQRLRDAGPAAALRSLQAALERLPELATALEWNEALSSVGDAAVRLLSKGSDSERTALASVLAAFPLGSAADAPEAFARAIAAAKLWLRLPAARASGRALEVASLCDQLAEALGGAEFSRAAAAARAEDAMATRRIEAARAFAAQGRVDEARAELATALAESPLHEGARAEAEAIERSVLERAQRHEAARKAASTGRLREAYSLVLADAQPGPLGAAATAFANELRAKLDLVSRGLDEVRAAVHGQAGGSLAGLRGCIARLEELAKVQCDHDELPRVSAMLQQEATGVQLAEAAMRAPEVGGEAQVSAALESLLSMRKDLLAPDRLDARIQALLERLQQSADRALMAGRLAAAEILAPALDGAAAKGLWRLDAVERIRASCAERRARAEAVIQGGKRQFAARDLAGAEAALAQAKLLWADGEPVMSFERELAGLLRREAAIVRAGQLAKDGHADAAREQIDGMGETPALLRTRIFDMKRDIAKAQGLQGAFVLRVDEGGEFLVLRGESVSIGNVRDGGADLPILCALAGRHARIARSMSFHGGMQDTIHAENGEVWVDGHKVTSAPLRPGSRIRLGASLQLAYSHPCARSLTAMLQLLGGFQAAGTDRVLLLKDRGRDGRICIGQGKDVHVRVGSATEEVEVFASKTGQLRVRCKSGGEIDGKPFADEHPVDAGAYVRAGGVSFVLMPWSQQR
ncbi:MAG: hypothetical protein RLZZ562_3096 [Planctomycetota bacterium]|jgi:hypothetical protein